MLAKIIAIITILLAPPSPPDDDLPDGAKPTDQHFCCEKLNGNGSGSNCTPIAPVQYGLCENVLYCAGSYEYEKKGAKVTCL